MDVRRERIPLLWSTVRERELAKGLSFKMKETDWEKEKEEEKQTR